MNVNERIRMIRLLEKLMADPQRAKELGIEGRIVKNLRAEKKSHAHLLDLTYLVRP